MPPVCLVACLVQIHYMMGSDGSSSTASHSEEDEPPFSFIIG